MKKTTPAIAFTAVFLLMCLIPLLGLLLSNPSQSGSREVPSAPPALLTADGSVNTAYLSDLSDYFSDHFYLRQDMITLHNLVIAGVFGASSEDDVLLGSEGWLYYASSLDDYTGAEGMTLRALYSAAANLRLIQEYCQSQGMTFLFAIAPNKNSIYGENMPDYGAVADIRDAQRLFSLLNTAGVCYADLFESFSGQDEVLYFAHDSHWNAKGAALAADCLNASFGLESAYYDGDFSQTVPHSGDLYEMLYPSLTDSEVDYIYGGGYDFSFGAGGTQPDSITINTIGPGEGTLLAFRDSFGNLLYPYLADSFASARFSRSVSYDLMQAGVLKADYVLVELVERNLDYLVTNVPVMPAPVRATPAFQQASGRVEISRVPGDKAPEGYVLLKGSLTELVDSDSPVYIVCGGICYEAFLLDGGGFAAYVPEQAAPESVLFISGGILLSQTVSN